MTDLDFNDREAELLKDIPEEFHGVVCGYAYEHGHSSGEHEVLWITEDLVERLQKPIANYTNRILGESLDGSI